MLNLVDVERLGAEQVYMLCACGGKPKSHGVTALSIVVAFGHPGSMSLQ